MNFRVERDLVQSKLKTQNPCEAEELFDVGLVLNYRHPSSMSLK